MTETQASALRVGDVVGCVWQGNRRLGRKTGYQLGVVVKISKPRSWHVRNVEAMFPGFLLRSRGSHQFDVVEALQ